MNFHSASILANRLAFSPRRLVSELPRAKSSTPTSPSRSPVGFFAAFGDALQCPRTEGASQGTLPFVCGSHKGVRPRSSPNEREGKGRSALLWRASLRER